MMVGASNVLPFGQHDDSERRRMMRKRIQFSFHLVVVLNLYSLKRSQVATESLINKMKRNVPIEIREEEAKKHFISPNKNE